jgi:hypothetical protein
MRIVSAQSAHWTDEQLIDHLYGIGPADDHLPQCENCLSRLSAMETRRRVSIDEPVSDHLLAAQRRAIYARLSEPHHWWSALSSRVMPVRRWAAATAMAAVLLGSASVYQYQNHLREAAESRADAQLAQDVSQMSFESEPPATAPLEGLFIE